MAFTTLSPWVIGQQLKAITINLMVTAIQELQSAATAVGMLPNCMELANATSQSIPTAVWTLGTETAAPIYSSGTGLTGTVNGVTIATTGRYLVTVTAFWAAGATGRRIIGMSTMAGGAPVAAAQNVTPGQAAGTTMLVTREMSFTAGDTIAVWLYQDSGAALAVTNRNVSVRQVG